MEIESAPYQFLVYHCIQRGRVPSRGSWMTYGQHLYDYFGFLEANGKHWRDCQYDYDHSIVAAYRDWSENVIGLEPSTINPRLRLINKFYAFAFKKGWVESLPYDIESVVLNKSKGVMAHADKSGGVTNSADVLLTEKRKILEILSKEQIEKLLEGTINVTLNNVLRLTVQTGLRKEEVLTFPLKYISNPASNTTHKSMIRINLDPRDMKLKGSKARAIDVPRGLMERLWDYKIHERHQCLVNNGIEDDPDTLFIKESGKSYRPKSSFFASQIKKVLGFGSLHLLRHTFATHTLYELRKKNLTTDPLLYVRDRLGHSSITTTEKYLHYLSEIEDDLITAFQEEVDAI